MFDTRRYAKNKTPLSQRSKARSRARGYGGGGGGGGGGGVVPTMMANSYSMSCAMPAPAPSAMKSMAMAPKMKSMAMAPAPEMNCLAMAPAPEMKSMAMAPAPCDESAFEDAIVSNEMMPAEDDCEEEEAADDCDASVSSLMDGDGLVSDLPPADIVMSLQSEMQMDRPRQPKERLNLKNVNGIWLNRFA